jgi:hypothetical protein
MVPVALEALPGGAFGKIALLISKTWELPLHAARKVYAEEVQRRA